MRLSPFDHRLDPASRTPIAVAVSGGADSLLALRLTVDWARARGRPVIALSVDHGLQPASSKWSASAIEAAERIGATGQVLRWEGAKRRSGVAAAARQARHGLLAEAARDAGASVIVTGHTGSDDHENLILGQGRLTEWSPSPVWPQGRGLFLLRPLLEMTRQAVRERLAAEGERWIDDPANEDDLAARVRARRVVGARAASHALETPTPALAKAAVFHGGVITIPRDAYCSAPFSARRRVLAAALVCAGGGERIASAESIENLDRRLTSDGAVTATLRGASLVARGDTIHLFRNAGEFRRAGRPEMSLAARETQVWDGRYEVTAGCDGMLQPLYGQGATLSPQERARVADHPAEARPGLPIFRTRSSAILATEGVAGVRWLVPERFAGACGLVAHEQVLARRAVGEWDQEPYLVKTAVFGTAS